MPPCGMNAYNFISPDSQMIRSHNDITIFNTCTHAMSHVQSQTHTLVGSPCAVLSQIVHYLNSSLTRQHFIRSEILIGARLEFEDGVNMASDQVILCNYSR